MKKSLLALAVLGAFAGTASAQSSVTIYGLLDLAVMKSNGGNAGNSGMGAQGLSEAWIVNQSAASRLGFRGTEDLGGGLSAQFQFEHRFAPDTGAQAGTSMWQGRSYVQLTSAAAGSVYLGREYIPAFWPAVKSDPFGWDGVGQIGGAMGAGFASNDPQGNGFRTSNTVGYKSPNWGGLTFQAATGLSETSGQGREDGFNVEYSGGPLYAAVGYEQISDGTLNRDGVSLLNFALHYNMGGLKFMGYYAMADIGALGQAEGDMWSIGMVWPIGPGNLKAAYYDASVDQLTTSGGVAVAGFSTSKFGIGYDYFISKRTNLYADYGYTKADNRDNNSAFAFGVKHTF
jgi:predicted porin